MKTINVLNLGAGVQSTMLYLLATQRHELLPSIDVAIFADTGDEPEAVYEHLWWLLSLNGPPILLRSQGTALSRHILSPKLRTSEPAGSGFASIPTFFAGGGMGRRECTHTFKIDVITRAIRRELVGVKKGKHFPTSDVHVNQYIGFSADEGQRAIRVRHRFCKVPWATPIFPLFDSNTDRATARNWLSSRVPHRVPRSACVECPYHSNDEWRSIASVPADWNKACSIDTALRAKTFTENSGLDCEQFLHRDRVPLAAVDLEAADPVEATGFAADCEGMCSL